MASEIQGLNQPCFEAVLKLCGWEVVVFHGITRTEHLGLLKSRDLAHGRQLDVFGKRGAESVDVDLAGVPPLRLHEHLVPVFVRKAVNLVFDAGAVSGPKTADAPVEHGRPVEPFAKQVVHLGRSVGDVARELLADGVGGEVGETARRFVAWLFFHFRVVQGPTVYAGRCAGLHSAAFKPKLLQLLCDAKGGAFTSTSASELFLADVHQAVEEGAVGEDHGLGADLHAKLGLDPDATSLFCQQPHHAVLPEVEVGRGLQHFAPCLGEEVAVVLGSWTPHGRPLGLVEHAELDGAAVGHQAGVAAERVHLAYDLTFGDASHGGVA